MVMQGYYKNPEETSPIVTLNPVDHYKETSVGKLLEQVVVKIVDADEHGRGEIAIKGPMVMQGYYKNPEETEKVLLKDGFLLTGDVGYLDSENYLYLTGRKKNMIVTEGGKNVYPEEIEDYFQLYEEVEQIMVKGYLLDQRMKTEGIEAFIYPPEEFTRGKTPEAVKARIDEVVAEVNKELHPYQRIHRVKVLSEPMEMTTTKKIKRFTVQDA
jgi:long-chain acyl-CoA synthetase